MNDQPPTRYSNFITLLINISITIFCHHDHCFNVHREIHVAVKN